MLRRRNAVFAHIPVHREAVKIVERVGSPYVRRCAFGKESRLAGMHRVALSIGIDFRITRINGNHCCVAIRVGIYAVIAGWYQPIGRIGKNL